jgi:hypothetical protein
MKKSLRYAEKSSRSLTTAQNARSQHLAGRITVIKPRPP